MTHQEIFDRVLAHLRKQQVRSVDISDYCVYRGPNGRTCAVGCLIPEEAYDPEMEGEIPEGLIAAGSAGNMALSERALMRALLASGLASDTWPLLHALQRAHDALMPDHKSGLEAWERRMQDIARDFELSYTEPAL